MEWLLIALPIGTFIAGLIIGRIGAGEEDEDVDLPYYERMARPLEVAARELIEDGARSFLAGYEHSADKNFRAADDLQSRARKIRKEAMDAMINGEFL